ncbi:hypothetical protein LZ318_36480 [Saccharopolyspora indica]|uniref:hypothetical protein n=1 Tax=Saccharopolyspora indica TaxID=1229659 RepID=UPI0022EADD50|nr:hypothetical protein [Saccharopolyspora indica]MDA3647654.1 hypothetical protein [Saccharopolyspora indica]
MRKKHPVVGEWTATVTRSDGVVERDLPFWFFADGMMEMVNTDGERCTGTWRATSPTGLAFDFSQPIRDEEGNRIGRTDSHQDVVVDCDTFEGRGGGIAYDNDGDVLGSAEAEITAKRC